MKLTGHKSAEIHRGYSHAEMETLRAAVTKLPGRPPPRNRIGQPAGASALAGDALTLTTW